jgi:putative ABC transport system ATP-binding protein
MSKQLSVIRLSKCFEKGSVNEKKALDGFSLEVSRGEFVTILGSNGAGKSTLFNAILGKFLRTAEDYSGRRRYHLLERLRRAANIGCLFRIHSAEPRPT